jgi:hypothetical protein
MWVIQPRRHRLVDGNQPAFAHVGEQDPDHAEREVEVSGEVSHRGGEAAQAQQGQVLGPEVVNVGPDPAHGGDHGHQVEGLAARAGPTAGNRVRADDRPGFPVKPFVVGLGHGPSLRLCVRAAGPGIDGQVLPDPLDQDRHLVGDEPHVGRGRG